MRTIVLLAVLVTAFVVPGCVNQAQGEKQTQGLWLLLQQEVAVGRSIEGLSSEEMGYVSTGTWYKTRGDCEKGGKRFTNTKKGIEFRMLCSQSTPTK